MKIFYSLLVLFLSTSFLHSQNYELINLTELYEKSDNFRENFKFHPQEINNEGDIVGVFREKMDILRDPTQLVYGSLNEGNLLLKTVDLAPIGKIFLNDNGLVLGTEQGRNIVQTEKSGLVQYSNEQIFLWSPKEDGYTLFQDDRCLRASAQGIDSAGNALISCMTLNGNSSLIWNSQTSNSTFIDLSLSSDSMFTAILGEEKAPVFKQITKYGDLLVFHPQNSRSNRSTVIFKRNGDDQLYMFAGLHQEKPHVLAINDSLKALMVNPNRGGGLLFSFWHEEGAEHLGVFHGASAGIGKAFLNSNGDFIFLSLESGRSLFHDQKNYYLYQDKRLAPLSEVVGIPSLEILDVVDFNDNGSILVRGKLNEQSSNAYFLLKVNSNPLEFSSDPLFTPSETW